MTVACDWRGAFGNGELNALHAEAFESRLRDDDWRSQVERHSLGWVTARDADVLVGFVNVAWDGGDHAFLIDTKVRPDHQRRGIGTELVRIAARHAREAGCEWLEVDFDDDSGHAPFYFDACGFRPTRAGLVHLPSLPPR